MDSNSNCIATLPTVPDLVERAQQGDPDAFAALFNTHKKRVYALCLRMTNHNVAQAEELTQDAFLQVFRKLSSFRGDSAFSTWLYRVAMNTVLMRFRRKMPAEVSMDEPYNKTSTSDPHSGYEGGEATAHEYATRDEWLETSVTRIALTRAISSLPDGYRSIFLMHDVEGYEHHEIAEIVGCTVGTSKSQLHKARLRIREILLDSRDASLEETRRERPSAMRAGFSAKRCLA